MTINTNSNKTLTVSKIHEILLAHIYGNEHTNEHEPVVLLYPDLRPLMEKFTEVAEEQEEEDLSKFKKVKELINSIIECSPKCEHAQECLTKPIACKHAEKSLQLLTEFQQEPCCRLNRSNGQVGSHKQIDWQTAAESEVVMAALQILNNEKQQATENDNVRGSYAEYSKEFGENENKG